MTNNNSKYYNSEPVENTMIVLVLLVYIPI